MTMTTSPCSPSAAPVSGIRPATAYRPTSHDIREHMHIVYKVVAQMQRRLPASVGRDELVAAGMIGLLDAIRKNDGDLGSSSFEAYACIRVRGAILDEIRLLDWAPRRTKAKAAARAAALLAGPAAAPAAPAAAAVSVVRFDDMPPAAEPACCGDSPEQQTEAVQVRRVLMNALASLPARERQILELRYFKEISPKEIAAMLGLSEARISQLHSRATATLRERLRELNPRGGSPPSMFPSPPAAPMSVSFRKAA